MVNDLGSVFSALSDPTRFRVVDLLRGRELCASELAYRCSTSSPAMSRHLRVLRKAGIVELAQADPAQDDARLRVYRLRAEPFASLGGWIGHMRAFWADQLDGFKTYAERRPRMQKRKSKKG